MVDDMSTDGSAEYIASQMEKYEKIRDRIMVVRNK